VILKKINLFLFILLYPITNYTSAIESFESSSGVLVYDSIRDREAIRSIIEETAETLLYDSLPKEKSSRYLVIDSVIKDIESTHCKTRVMRLQDKTVGYMAYKDNTTQFLTFIFRNHTSIEGFAIAKDFQGRGHGSHLFTSVIHEIEATQTVPSINLYVKSSNLSAKNLYKKTGFISEAEMLDICFMSKKLTIPANKLPPRNFIQRHPKATLGLGAAAYIAYTYS